MEEGINVLHAEGITPAPMSGPDPVKLRGFVRLPNFIYQPIANRMTTIDPQARSSMWEDLNAGRSCEIDYLQGEICKLGDKHGIPTPVNDRILKLVKKAFADKQSPALSGKALRALL